jgi:FtsZ-binding cell division protein ZapB
MINLEQVRQLQAKVQEAVGLIAELKAENQGLKDTITHYESKIGELESAMSLIREDQHEIEEGIQEALTKLDSIGSTSPKPETPPAVSQENPTDNQETDSNNTVAEDDVASGSDQDVEAAEAQLSEPIPSEDLTEDANAELDSPSSESGEDDMAQREESEAPAHWESDSDEENDEESHKEEDPAPPSDDHGDSLGIF